MEAMNVWVETIHRCCTCEGYVATVSAVSGERVNGFARATTQIILHLEDPRAAVTETELRQQAREEALRYLDVA